MAPVPLEGNQTPVNSNMVQEGSKGGSVSLSLLIDFAVQRTYHEITVLAELLPRKTDVDRKVDIYNFSSRTRQLFVRLLALVKWANSASKVDKSTHIMAFLDKQAMLFVDTADMLARMSRETVVRARLPNFQMSAAIEVLTTGTYSRMPSCIKDRIVPSEPITPAEKRITLLKLNQVIQHRLVSSNLLPQMRTLNIENGRVTFHIQHEFEVSLTVMGDSLCQPWHLLDVKILVEDKEVGDGKPLVHPLQVHYVHQVLQSRIADCPDPLKEVYSFLHFFCQSLQLEVLFSQTKKLCKDRLEGHVHTDEYCPGKCLSISYWRELTSKDPKSELGYILTLVIDTNRCNQPLTIIHVPSLTGEQETEIAEQFAESGVLSIERLLVHTVYIRTKNRLSSLQKELEDIVKGVEYSLKGCPAVLSLSVLVPCLYAEKLQVAIDTHTGMIQCHVPQFITTPSVILELQHAFNMKRTAIVPLIKELRFLITQTRCIKTLQSLPVTVKDSLPLLYDSSHPINKIGKHKMFVKFHKHANLVLAIEIKENETNPCEMKYNCYVVQVRKCSIEETAESQSTEPEALKLYLKVLTCTELNSFVATHGPFTNVNEVKKECEITTFSRALCKTIVPVESVQSKLNHPSYFIPELAHIVAMCDERIPFTLLAEELTKRDIVHQGIQVETNAMGLCLKIIHMPLPPGISLCAGWRTLLKRLLSVTIRSFSKTTCHYWVIELVMYGSPIASASIHARDQGMRRPIYLQHEMNTTLPIPKMVDSFLSEWSQIVHLYCLVEDLVEYFRLGKYNLLSMVTIKSYNYSKLVLAYGPGRQATATIQWNTNKNAFNIIFGSMGNCSNAHTLVREQLEDHLNKNRNLAQLIHMLHETYQPLVSISKLPKIPQMCINITRPLNPVLTFAIIAQSPTVLRIIYESTYCLELILRGDNIVSIRDGAYSKFDRTSVVLEYVPTQGLKAFLSKYEDETAVLRRRSQSEDDNPPSPIRADASVDSPSGFLSGGHHRGPQSPAQREAGLRFHPPLTPPSNPHTPASPHTSSISQHQAFGSSPATSFNMASPPSLASNVNPSPSMLPHPSPGSGLLASSPSNPLHVPSPAGLLPIASPGPSSGNVPVGHSPAGAYLSQSGHSEGSPFPTQSMASPANWPGSPGGMPRRSPARPGQSPGSHTALHSPDHKQSMGQMIRILPQKSWAGAIPTILSYEALDVLCSPCLHPQGLPGPELSPLERFLGCVFLRRQLQRCIQSEDGYVILNSEPGVIHFKVESLQCRVFLNQHHLQSLHIKISTLPENKEPWNAEDLQVLEKFFETRGAAPPYKPHSIMAFLRMLSCSYSILKDFIQIMKLELIPGLVQQQQMKWTVQWCLRIPPSAFPIMPTGHVAVVIIKNKILFYLNITRVGYGGVSDMPSIVLPILYDVANNVTQIAEKRDVNSPPSLSLATIHIKRFSEFGMSHNECSIFPVIRDLLMNFTLPTEQPQMASSPAVQSPMMVTVQMQQAASPMMHSPMMQTVQQPGTPPVTPQMMSNPSGPPQGYPVPTILPPPH